METADITSAYAAYDREITWERHLLVVDELATWSPQRLLELHDGLVHHVAAGMWVSTAIGQRFEHVFPDDPADLAALMEELANGGTLPTIELAAPPLPGIPPNRVGLPVSPIWSLPSPSDVARTGRSYSAARRKIASYFNHTNYLPNGEGLILRAAPWAYQRITGERMLGFDADPEEDALSPEAHERDLYSIRATIGRGPDTVELTFLSWASPTAAAAEASWSNDEVLASLLRSLQARRVGEAELEFVRGWDQFVPGVGIADGQLIASGSSRPVGKGGALYSDLRAMLGGDSIASGPEPLGDEEFWRLIDLLGGVVTQESLGVLITALSKRTVKEIAGFQETLARTLFALDRRELLSIPSESGAPPMSDDVFLHFRCAIVAGGAEAVARMLAAGRPIVEREWHPEHAEGIVFIAGSAYERRTRRASHIQTTVSIETGSNPDGWGLKSTDSRAPAYVVRGVRDGEERIQFWRTPSADEAIRRHLAANPGFAIDPEVDVPPHPDVLTKSNKIVPIGIVYFARPVASASDPDRSHA